MSRFSTFALIMFLIPSFVGGLLIGLGLNYSPFPVEIPSSICSSRIKLDNLDLLDQLITNFDKENPWDNSTNYTCWYRSVDFLKLAKTLGYNGSIQYGCRNITNNTRNGCHAWTRIYIDVFGNSEDYPIPVYNVTRKYYEIKEELFFRREK